MTKASKAQEASKARPVLGLIRIDNYDEVAGGVDGDLIGGVERKIRDYIRGEEGVLYSVQPGKYACVLDAGALGRMRKEKYLLLDQVRDIPSPSGMPITLSIALGIGDGLQESATLADQAMMLAQGRGGDQAVENRKGNYSFYGGRHQPEERYSRVKIRVFAQALRQLMGQYDRVYVMGHKMPDYDALGAALGVMYCAQLAEKPVFLVLDDATAMVEMVLDKVRKDGHFEGEIVDEEEAMAGCDGRALVVVVDTQRVNSVPAPEVLASAGAVAVIDHHRRGADAITATLQHVQVSSSSSSELVCEIVEYFQSGSNPPPIVSSALLAGITMDTKHFTVNAGARTLEAAAYLYRHGADNKLVSGFFQDDIESYLARADIIRQARALAGGILLGSYPVDRPDANRLAAQAADTMANMRRVEGAFVLYVQDGEVNISARSTGDMNVQVILETLGGGGHLNAAGAKLKGEDMATAEAEVAAAVRIYLQDEARVAGEGA